MSMSMHVYACVRVCMKENACVRVWAPVCVCVCLYVCVCVHVCRPCLQMVCALVILSDCVWMQIKQTKNVKK